MVIKQKLNMYKKHYLTRHQPMHMSSFSSSKHNGVPEVTNPVLIIFVSSVKPSTVLGIG